MTLRIPSSACAQRSASTPRTRRSSRHEAATTAVGRKVLVEQYEPGDRGKHPALILLHGSAGVLFPGLDLRKRARSLAREGYAVFIPHYFDRTGHVMVRPSMVHENLSTWTGTVQDCVTYVSARPNVDAKRIGLTGHSLGGYLALATAARDQRVKVVIEASGAFENYGINGCRRLSFCTAPKTKRFRSRRLNKSKRP